VGIPSLSFRPGDQWAHFRITLAIFGVRRFIRTTLDFTNQQIQGTSTLTFTFQATRAKPGRQCE
jgi:hypothetical protein